MAPELTFKQGATTAVSLHMDNIHGAPLIKGVVWTAASLEENFGVLQKDMVREVNCFIKKECPKISRQPKIVSVNRKAFSDFFCEICSVAAPNTP